MIRLEKKQWVFLISLCINLLFLTIDYLDYYFNICYNYLFLFMGLTLIGLRKKVKKNFGFIFGMLFLCGMLAIIANDSGFGSIIILFWPFAIALAFMGCDPSKTFLLYISKIALLFLIVLVIKTYFIYDHSLYRYRVTPIAVNPNSTGFLIIYLYFLSEMDGNSSILNRLVKLILVFAGALQCGARTSLLAFVILIAGGPFIKRCITHHNITVGLIFFIIAFGSVFPFLYIMAFKIMDHVLFLGEDIFSGRQEIWVNVINYVKQNPQTWLFGTGYDNITFYPGAFNIHNAYWQMFAQFGLPITCVYFLVVIKIVNKSFHDRIDADIRFKAILIIMLTLLVGIMDTTLEWVPLLIFPGFAYGLLLSGKNDFEEIKR